MDNREEDLAKKEHKCIACGADRPFMLPWQGGKQAAMACMAAMSGRTCAAMGFVYCPKVFFGAQWPEAT